MDQVDDIRSAIKMAVPFLVDDVSLFRQDVIIILEVFADIEVFAFDLFLGVGDRVGQHLVLVGILLEVFREEFAEGFPERTGASVHHQKLTKKRLNSRDRPDDHCGRGAGYRYDGIHGVQCRRRKDHRAL
jgi:hypothetical protein